MAPKVRNLPKCAFRETSRTFLGKMPQPETSRTPPPKLISMGRFGRQPETGRTPTAGDGPHTVVCGSSPFWQVVEKNDPSPKFFALGPKMSRPPIFSILAKILWPCQFFCPCSYTEATGDEPHRKRTRPHTSRPPQARLPVD